MKVISMNAPLTRAAIVAEARAWIGTPYRHQASLKGIGCDCLGLLRGIWRGEGWLPHLDDVAVLALMFVLVSIVSARVFRWE